MLLTLSDGSLKEYINFFWCDGPVVGLLYNQANEYFYYERWSIENPNNITDSFDVYVLKKLDIPTSSQIKNHFEKLDYSNFFTYLNTNMKTIAYEPVLLALSMYGFDQKLFMLVLNNQDYITFFELLANEQLTRAFDLPFIQKLKNAI